MNQPSAELRKPDSPELTGLDWLVKAGLAAGVFAACDFLLMSVTTHSPLASLSSINGTAGFFAFLGGMVMIARGFWKWWARRRTARKLGQITLLWLIVIFLVDTAVILVEMQRLGSWRDVHDLRDGWEFETHRQVVR